MRPTRFFTLLGVIALDGFVALLASDLFARQGRPVFIAPASLAFTLPAIAILLAAFAWPIFRYRRDLASVSKAKATKRAKRVDPFYAVRVLLLAKASSLAASAIFGWQLGVVVYLLSRPAQVADSLTRTIAVGVGGFVLLTVALIIERVCRLPNDGKTVEGLAGSSESEASA